MGETEVSTSVVKWSEGLNKSVYQHWKIYRSNQVCCLYGCLVYHILSYSSNSILYRSVFGRTFCVLQFNFVNYVLLLLLLLLLLRYVFFCYVHVFLLLCMFWFVFGFIVLFCVLFVCKCVSYYCHRVSTKLHLNISYHISCHVLSYHISCHIMSYRIISYIIPFISYIISYHLYHIISFISYRIISYVISRVYQPRPGVEDIPRKTFATY